MLVNIVITGAVLFGIGALCVWLLAPNHPEEEYDCIMSHSPDDYF